jgi:hypothetical protein
MNWGLKIIFSYIAFIVFVIILVYRSVTAKIDLVTDNYYEKELRYQEQIDIMNNTGKLNKKTVVRQDNNFIEIIFPVKPQGGMIHLYRPSDASKDLNLEISNVDNSLSQYIDITALDNGYWKVKINWITDGTEYYAEENLMIRR